MNSPVLSAASPLSAEPHLHPPRALHAASMGAMLLDAGKLTPENAEHVLRMQKELGIRFGEAAQRLGLVSEADIHQVLARQFDYPYLQRGDANYSPRLVAAFEPFSPQAEALRAVRSQLMLRWFGHGRRALAIVGVGEGDGVSMFAANLAVVFSQLGEQTLLVDANLRRPCQHDIFDLKGRQGLSDLLAGRAGLDTIQRIASFADLSVLPAGTLPPNPQELLARAAFRSFNTQLEARYGVVLYDVPPFSAGVDALAVASRAGGVLLVARKDRTRVASVSRMAEQMAQAGAEVVGSVVVDF
jgi:chain length determinant protein tyrosine kinase EpsG